MALLGGAWTPNIVWYLSSGPRRFGELRVDIPDISAKVLSGRLRELAAKRLVTRRVKPTSPPSVEYELTELGKELLPAIAAIVEVGKKLKSNNGRSAEAEAGALSPEAGNDPAPALRPDAALSRLARFRQ